MDATFKLGDGFSGGICPEVGSVFEADGVKYRTEYCEPCVPARCGLCDLSGLPGCEYIKCSENVREDDQNVIFFKEAKNAD